VGLSSRSPLLQQQTGFCTFLTVRNSVGLWRLRVNLTRQEPDRDRDLRKGFKTVPCSFTLEPKQYKKDEATAAEGKLFIDCQTHIDTPALVYKQQPAFPTNLPNKQRKTVDQKTATTDESKQSKTTFIFAKPNAS